MIPSEKQLDYVAAQIVKETEQLLQLQKKEAEKQLQLKDKEAEKLLQLQKKEAEQQLQLEKKEAEKQLQLKDAEKLLQDKEAEKLLQLKDAENLLAVERERAENKMQTITTGLLWKLKTQTQRHALEMFLSDCWERMKKLSKDEIKQIRRKISKFPSCPANVTVSATHCLLL